MFTAELVNGVLATAQAFDGSANVLCLTLPPERGGANLTAMILDTLHTHRKSNLSLDTTKRIEESGSNRSVSITAAPDSHQPHSLHDSRSEPENVTEPIGNTKPTVQSPQQKKNISAAYVSGKLSEFPRCSLLFTVNSIKIKRKLCPMRNWKHLLDTVLGCVDTKRC